MRINPCKYCGNSTHTSIMCFDKPRKSVKKIGKQGLRWIETRRDWIIKNPPSPSGLWFCHYCGDWLTSSTLTLDHKDPRGSHADKRYDHSNLVPCCWDCNFKKGSKSYEQFKQELSNG